MQEKPPPPGHHPASPAFLKELATEHPLIKIMWDACPLGILIIVPGNSEKHPVLIGDCNQVTCDLHGYTRDEMVGQSMDLTHAVPWTPTINKSWFKNRKSAESITGRSLHRHKNGDVFTIEYNLTFVEINGIECAIGFDKLVTEFDGEQTKLHGIANRWVNAMESSEEGIWEIDLTKGDIWTSPRWQYIVGKPQREAFQPLEEVLREIHPDDIDAIRQKLEKVKADEAKTLEVEGRFRNADGSWLWLSLKGKVSYDRDNRPEKILGSMTNITERKIAEKQLILAQQKAEEANQAKSQFLAAMSHEIRTPMNGVLGMATLMEDTPLNGDQKLYLKTISESGNALLSIINEILHFSKLEASAVALELESFDIVSSVYKAIEIVRPLASDKKIELLFSVDPELPTQVIGDQNRIRQILVNILGNAIKFTAEGEIELSIDATPVEPSPEGKQRSRFSIAVRDSGIGIEPDKVEQLFQPFSQADASTTRQYGGTGLGLAICQKIAELMDGDIEVSSEKNAGSTFTTRLVLQTRGRPANSTVSDLQGKRALIIAPKNRSREILVRYLETLGINTEYATDPEAAHIILEQGAPFDFAFLDLGPDPTKTRRFAREMKIRNTLYPLPFISLENLGYETKDRKDRGIFSARLLKPLSPGTLVQTLVDTLFPPGVSAETSSRSRNTDAPAVERPERVLLVEDNQVNQLVASSLLQKCGFKVDLAESGLTALDRCIEKSYDIIFMDIQMPGMNGFETLEHLRNRLVPGGHLPWIIALTAGAMEEDRTRCLEAGMDDYLAKPLRVEELTAALERASEELTKRS